MAHEEYTFVQRGDVEVAFAFPSAPGGSSAGSYTEDLCIDGDFTINDSIERETLEVSDWCQSQTPGAINAGTDGGRTVTADFTLQMILASEEFEAFVGNYNTPNENIWVRATRKDQETNVTTWTETLRGRLTQLNRTDRATGTSQLSASIEVHEIVSSTFNTAE